jgi:hypothetical protein
VGHTSQVAALPALDPFFGQYPKAHIEQTAFIASPVVAVAVKAVTPEVVIPVPVHDVHATAATVPVVAKFALW